MKSQAIGIARGGPNTKLHAVVDGKGGSIRLQLTAGQVSEAKIGPGLVSGLKGVRIVADKSYDSHRMREAARDAGSHSAFPNGKVGKNRLHSTKAGIGSVNRWRTFSKGSNAIGGLARATTRGRMCS